MSEFDVYRLVENQEQATVYFAMIDEICKFIQTNPQHKLAGISTGDLVRGATVAVAVAGYQLGNQSPRFKYEGPEQKEALKKLYGDTLEALYKQTTLKQFETH